MLLLWMPCRLNHHADSCAIRHVAVASLVAYSHCHLVVWYVSSIGGSGGLATAKEAHKYGARVAVLDYVKPSPAGNSMHTAELRHFSSFFLDLPGCLGSNDIFIDFLLFLLSHPLVSLSSPLSSPSNYSLSYLFQGPNGG